MAWLRIALAVAAARALRAPAAPRVRGPAARRAATTECDAVVVGCGPAGLAAAVELRARGFARVVAVDRRGAPNEFEPQKAYLYLLDARGQRWTDARNATAAMAARGVRNEGYSITRLYPDARGARTMTPILSRPSTAKAIWIPRASFLAALAAAAEDAGAELRHGAAVAGARAAADGRVEVALAGGDVLRAPLVVGADGARSAVRGFLAAETGGDFAPRALPSPSGGLRYKMLALPPDFGATNLSDGAALATNHSAAYTVLGASTSRRRRVRLGLLPSRDPALPRTANVIKPADHEVWTLDGDPERVRAWLDREFPQLDRGAASDAAVEAFAAAAPGAFPDPQYAPATAATLPNGARAFLVGDAIHAFPPDLGQGVNAALEDVAALGAALAPGGGGVAAYDAERAPAAEALARLVQCGFPYQYDQAVWRARAKMLGVGLRAAASAAAARLLPPRVARHVPPPIAFSVLDGDAYALIWRRAKRATRAYAALAAAAAVAVARACLA